MDFYKIWKSKITTANYVKIRGWGILRCDIDGNFHVWMAEARDYIHENTIYPYDEFTDCVSWLPVYFFHTFEQAKQFCETKSNHYPIDRALYWLQYSPEYWFSTIAERYIDYINYMTECEKYYKHLHAHDYS